MLEFDSDYWYYSIMTFFILWLLLNDFSIQEQGCNQNFVLLFGFYIFKIIFALLEKPIVIHVQITIEKV